MARAFTKDEVERFFAALKKQIRWFIITINRVE